MGMESRMYFLCLYSISPIQKGIQAGHAALEYSEKYQKDRDYKYFVKYDKTFILLDGGTSGDMESHLEYFKKNGIKHAEFREPDLNNSISAIAFIVKDRVYKNKDQSAFGKWLIIT